MQNFTELPSPEGSIANGNPLTVRVPRGRQCRALTLSCLRASDVQQTRAIMVAEVTTIDLRANGHHLVRDLTATNLFLLNNYAGAAGADGADDDGAIRIEFADKRAKVLHTPDGPFDGESLSIGGEGLSSLDLQFTVGTLDGTNPMVRVRPSVEQTDNNAPPGLVRRYIQASESGWGTVKKGLSLVPVKGEVLRRLHITGYGSGVLSEVEIYSQGKLAQRLYAADLTRAARAMGGTPQSGMHSIELGRVGHILDGLPLSPDMQPSVQLTWSTAPDSNVFTTITDSVVEFSSLGA